MSLFDTVLEEQRANVRMFTIGLVTVHHDGLGPRVVQNVGVFFRSVSLLVWCSYPPWLLFVWLLAVAVVTPSFGVLDGNSKATVEEVLA